MAITKLELQGRLDSIIEQIESHLHARVPILASTQTLLIDICSIARGEDLEHRDEVFEEGPIVISCDASIVTNPGGPAAAAHVIEVPGGVKTSGVQRTPALTNNQAEYDAVYQGLGALVGLINIPTQPIEVRSDSQIVIRQLNGEMKCNDPTLERRRRVIRELVAMLPVPVTFVWRPRNSTPGLSEANQAAQTLLGVRVH